MEYFAKALNMAIVENPDFRKLIKSELTKQFDGDYDMLMLNSLNLDLHPSETLVTKSGCANRVTVKDLLSYYYVNIDQATKSNNQSIEDLLEEYPDLQISMPVNAEEWKAEEYVPDIVIIPSDFVEFETLMVPGINSMGEDIQVDAINEPDVPVLVVGQSERTSSRQLTILSPVNKLNKGATILLDLLYTGNSVKVSAEVYTGQSIVNSISLYRSFPNSNVFSCIGAIPINGLVYNDYNIVEGVEYTYYAIINSTSQTAYGGSVSYDNLSNNVTIKTDSAVPNPVMGFNVVNEYATKNLLSWENPSGEMYRTQILRTTPDNSDEIVAMLDPTVTHYYDNSVVPGEKWTYYVHKVNENTNALSSYRKAYIYNPYRDPSGESKVIIKRIHIDKAATEVWLFGRPEVYITAFGQTLDNGGNIVVDTLGFADVEFPSKKKFEENPKNIGLAYDENDSGFINCPIADWSFFDDSEYYPVLNINMREYDKGTAKLSARMDVKGGYKKEDSIDIELCGSFEYCFEDQNRDCGTLLLRYYENPEKNLTFTNYDSYITISEIDDNN